MITPELLQCSRKRKYHANDGWSFPHEVRELLMRHCEGKSVLHLFGGKADFGVRLDIDPLVRPDVIGSAWAPPFARDSFDVVIMDPPYFALNTEVKIGLFRNAAWIAREYVWWFHTVCVALDSSLVQASAWVVIPCRNGTVRILQKFSVREPKRAFFTDWTRGPMAKYRWRCDDQMELIKNGNSRTKAAS